MTFRIWTDITDTTNATSSMPAPAPLPASLHLRRLPAWAAAGLVAAACAGCGGGSASVGPAPAQPSTTSTLASQIGSTSNVAGQDTLDAASFWDTLVLNGYERVGSLTGYWHQDFRWATVRMSYLGLNATRDKTRVKVEHPDHGAKLGDQVQLSGFSDDVSGLKMENLQARLEIVSATPSAYEVLVEGVASGAFVTDLSLNLNYRHVDCRGTQRVSQGKLIKDEKLPNGDPMPAKYFNFTKASRTEQTVVTRLQGCSPPESEFTTTRYFPYEPSSGPVRYPLLGQVISGGDYSLVDSFNLPASQLKTGDTGTIALIANFADASRRNRIGRTTIRYDILKHTSQSVFVALVSETYDANDAKQVEMTDYYGRDPAKPGDPYSLVRTVVKYNNPRRTEMVIDYQAAPAN